MCGILAGFDRSLDPSRLAHRGPDAQRRVTVGAVTLGHTRLAIQDPQPRSDQPFTFGDVTLAFNGEIFNHRELRGRFDHRWLTESDTETLAVGLASMGADFLPLIDGMFAAVWVDENEPDVLHAARDRQGEIPLHLSTHPTVVVSSERKALDATGKAVVDIGAGTYNRITATGMKTHRWHTLEAAPAGATLEESAVRIRLLLEQAVAARSIADVPVCTLLSGGIDSAIIALHLKQIVPDLVCYTARLDPRSPDLIAARLVAETIGAPLIEVDVPPPTADDLSEVVRVIEQPSKAQTEIGWACLQLAQRIDDDGFKVTFSGEASDELWGSYEMSYHGIRQEGWYGYRRNLTARQASKNFPRVNKVFMAHGVEARLPFCDPRVVDYALSLPEHAVRTGKDAKSRKAILSRAYSGALPAAITDREKVAFQTGLGLSKVIPVRDPARYYKAEFRRMYG
jgi:asparagine synthase (glutamine-hydrolysing)